MVMPRSPRQDARHPMIRYDLRCSQTHEFDGWFQDSAGFTRLAAAGLVECPRCGDIGVTKRLMAPAVRTSHAAAPLAVPPAPPEPPNPAPTPATLAPQAVGGRLPPQMLAVLQRMRAEVEARCDYVGRDFAAEARRIHNGESARDGIYGEATEAEAEALVEDGIGVARIPWVPRADG
jgi:hypothetical protein